MTSLPGAGVIQRLADALYSDLAGREMTVGWTHGDFHLGNIIVGPDRRVTGSLTWARPASMTCRFSTSRSGC